MVIKRAVNSVAIELTDLTIRSKSHWNYSKEQIEAWREDLTITQEYISTHNVYTLHDKGSLAGYYSYKEVTPTKVLLDNIFIDPEFIGKGYGKALMEHFMAQVTAEGHQKIELYSEPNATDFYLKLDFKIVGQLKTSIPNRFLPIMELVI